MTDIEKIEYAKHHFEQWCNGDFEEEINLYNEEHGTCLSADSDDESMKDFYLKYYYIFKYANS